MKRYRFWALVLGAALVLFSWLGNRRGPHAHTVMVFPDAWTLIVLPVVILLALWHRSRAIPAPSGAELRRFAWGIVWPAALIFAAAQVAFGLMWFSDPTIRILLMSFAGTVAITVAFGLVAGLAGASWFARSNRLARGGR